MLLSRSNYPPFIVAGAWSVEDQNAVCFYNERVAHLRALEAELEDCEHENRRPARATLFAIEAKAYRPTADLRSRIAADRETLHWEYLRLVEAGKGVR